MRAVFVDTLYWVAQINSRDQWHARARQIEPLLKSTHLITTEVVLIEVLNYFCSYGSQIRSLATDVINIILEDPKIEVIYQSQDLFINGLQLYEMRLDKGYSLTDCISMVVMKQYSISEILTHDRHFAQEGFTILL